VFSRRHCGAADEDGEKRRQDKGGYYGKTVGREQGTVGDDRGACRREHPGNRWIASAGFTGMYRTQRLLSSH
jgi:hypothetical protein